MTHAPRTTPLGKVRWVIGEVRTALATETHVTGGGTVSTKDAARRNDDRVPFDTLRTVLWNVAGRHESPGTIAGREMATA